MLLFSQAVEIQLLGICGVAVTAWQAISRKNLEIATVWTAALPSHHDSKDNIVGHLAIMNSVVTGVLVVTFDQAHKP